MSSKDEKEEVEEVEEEEEEEEDLVDPHDTLRQECRETSTAARLMGKYEECERRVDEMRKEWEEKKMGAYPEHCGQESNEFLHYVDSCAAKSLFKHLK